METVTLVADSGGGTFEHRPFVERDEFVARNLCRAAGRDADKHWPEYREQAKTATDAAFRWLWLHGDENKRRLDAMLDAAIAAGPEAMRAVGLSEGLIRSKFPGAA